MADENNKERTEEEVAAEAEANPQKPVAQESQGAEQDAGGDAEQESEADDGLQISPAMQNLMAALKEVLPHAQPEARSDGWVELKLDRDGWQEVATSLRDSPQLNFDYLSMISAVDYKEKGFQVVYHLLSLMANQKLVVKIDLPDREDAKLPSVIDVWPTAAFHEREAWDLMGIWFDGHPNLRRILMREDWVGHPLRKDYVDDRAPRERVTKETYRETYR